MLPGKPWAGQHNKRLRIAATGWHMRLTPRRSRKASCRVTGRGERVQRKGRYDCILFAGGRWESMRPKRRSVNQRVVLSGPVKPRPTSVAAGQAPTRQSAPRPSPAIDLDGTRPWSTSAQRDAGDLGYCSYLLPCPTRAICGNATAFGPLPGLS